MDLLIKHADVVRFTKAQRMRWTGHIVRLDKEGTVKIITAWRPIAVRRIGRRRLRWEHDVRADLGGMKYRIEVRWLWIGKHGRELLSGPKLVKSCSARRRRILLMCLYRRFLICTANNPCGVRYPFWGCKTYQNVLNFTMKLI